MRKLSKKNIQNTDATKARHVIMYAFVYNIIICNISYVVFIIFMYNTPQVTFPEDTFIFLSVQYSL